MQETTAQANHTVPSTVEMTSPGLAKLYNNSEFSDVVVKCGELAIKAHTFVLCAHSDTFRAAFNNKDGWAVISFKRVAVYKKYPNTFLNEFSCPYFFSVGLDWLERDMD
jgi:hypothetical protein